MKKILSVTIALLMVAMVFIGCNDTKKESGSSSQNSSVQSSSSEQQKKLTKVKVTVDINGEVKSFDYETDKETLEALLLEKTEELKATLKDSEYGKFVEGMNGYVADSKKNEFFEVLVDGVSSKVGIKEIKIEEGKAYQFKLSKF